MPTPTIPTIRIATSDDDHAAAYRLRYELYVEGQQLFIDEADHGRRWLGDDYDACAQIFIAEHAGRVVGTARVNLGNETTFTGESREAYDFARFAGIVEERDIAVCTRVAIRPEYRGGDLGFRLFEACWGHVAENNAELILGNCEPHLLSHYLKLGSRPFGELDNHSANGARARIAVVVGDTEFLRRVRSPMLAALSRRTRSNDAVPAILAAMDKGRSVTLEQEVNRDTYWAEVCRHLKDENGRLRGALADLDRDEAETLLAGSQILACREGDALFLRGHASRTPFVLLSGSLVVRDALGAPRQLSEAGALVGEAAFFSGECRLRDALAGSGGAKVLALNGRTLKHLLASHLAVASKFLHAVTRSLCQRLTGQRTHAPVAGAPRARTRFQRNRRHRSVAALGSRRRSHDPSRRQGMSGGSQARIDRSQRPR